jgi:hypothetical protein
MGNVVGTVHGDSDTSVVVAAHMDEIGFMVRHVTEEGVHLGRLCVEISERQARVSAEQVRRLRELGVHDALAESDVRDFHGSRGSIEPVQPRNSPRSSNRVANAERRSCNGGG